MTSLDASQLISPGSRSSICQPENDGATQGLHLNAPSSSSEIDEEFSSPTSSLFDPSDRQLTNKLSTIQFPDLRFEQGYLTSLMSCFHFNPPNPLSEIHNTSKVHDSQKPAQEVSDQESKTTQQLSHNQVTDDDFYLGSNFHVDWKMVAYVTVRDQLFYPLLQGYLWGSATLFLSHLWNIKRRRSREHGSFS